MKRASFGVALIGPGAMAAQHAVALHALGCKVNAVFGPSRHKVERFAQRYGIDRSTIDLRELLDDDDIDAVVIASPNDVHAEQAIAAAEMGKHILCELPLATSLVDAERVVGIVRSVGVKSMVCQTQRFYPSVARIRMLTELRDVDPLYLMSVLALRRRQNENLGMMGVNRNWVDNIVWHHGSHAIDTALWLLNDEIRELQATCGRPDPASGQPIDISITLQTRSGQLAVSVLSYSSRTLIQETTLITESETFRIKNGSLCNDSTSSAETLAAVRRAAVEAQDELFVRSVLDEVTPRPSAADLLPLYEALSQVDSQIAESIPNTENGEFRHLPGAGGVDPKLIIEAPTE